jgi:hypothetical protein
MELGSGIGSIWGCVFGAVGQGGQGIGLADTQIYRNIANYSTVVFFWWRQVAGLVGWLGLCFAGFFGLTDSVCGLHFRVL